MPVGDVTQIDVQIAIVKHYIVPLSCSHCIRMFNMLMVNCLKYRPQYVFVSYGITSN